MKLILVPPGLVAPMLAALRAEPSAELPSIGGMPVLVSRHCPPDTGYILNGEAIPRVEESLWRKSWADAEPPAADAYRFQHFAIDYAPRTRKWNPPPPWGWRQRLKWRLWWWKIRALNWWHRFRWESRSPFED